MSKKSKDSAAENIKVLVRCRPLSEKEKNSGHKSCVDMNLTTTSVSVKSLTGDPDRWTFDAVINNSFTQADIFTQYILPLVNCVMNGFNATVFAYGQSGSGKTHTMTGVMGNAELEGVIPRCIQQIFATIDEMKKSAPNKAFTMSVSFVELYNGKVRDLLAKQQVALDVRQRKDQTFFVQGANIPTVVTPQDIIRLMEEGTDRRRVAATELNSDSSRSHSLFTLIMSCAETLEDGTVTVVTSKLNLVDLAGSERQGKTGASGDTLKEGCNINLSLSALGTVIDCLVKGAPHIPFRSSPLTMLLKDSLGGNSKTVMFANINPSENNVSETVSTLRFADRAKQIKNKPVVNMDSKDQKIAELSALIAELKEKLQKYETEGTESLEKEVETLHGQRDELEVNLENAIKGREADRVDFQNAQAKIAAERQAFNAQLVEMEEQITQLKNDLQVAESTIKDEKQQREEVLALCASRLRNGKEIRNVDELDAVLRDQSHGANSAVLAQLNTQVQTLTAEKKCVVKELKAIKSEMEVKLKESKETSRHAEIKMKKMQKELTHARETQKNLEEELTAAHAVAEEAVAATTAGRSDTAPSPALNATPHISPQLSLFAASRVMVPAQCEEMKSLRDATAETQKQLENVDVLKSIDKKLSALRKEHEAMVTGQAKELEGVKRHMASPASDEEGDLLQQFRGIIGSGDAESSQRLALVGSLFQLVRRMRTAWRAAHAVPLAILSGDANAAKKSINEMESVDAQTAEVHAESLRAITADLTKAYEQRNALLDAIAASHPEIRVELKKEVRTVIGENSDLRHKCESLSNEKEEMYQQVVEEQRAAAVNSTLTKAATEAEVRAATAAMQAEVSRKERAMMEAVKLDDNGAAAVDVLKKEVEQLRTQLEAQAASAASSEELTATKAELEEVKVQYTAMEKARDELYNQLNAQRKEVGEAEERVAELTGKMNELERECERRLAAATGSASEVEALEHRLKERAEQLDQMRDLIEKQKKLIVKGNEKTVQVKEKMQQMQATLQEREEQHRAEIEERDACTQKLINERLAEYAELRESETVEQTKKQKKLKKKMMKMVESMAAMETDYDKKVLECEELRQVLGDQKVEQLRLQRRLEGDESALYISDQRGTIQSTLESAKEERRRRADLFALGEVPNAKQTMNMAQMRPGSQGSGAG